MAGSRRSETDPRAALLGLVHELRTPLASALASLEQLQRLAGGIREALDRYRRELGARGGADLSDFETKLEEAGGVDLLDELLLDAREAAQRAVEITRAARTPPRDAPRARVPLNRAVDSALRLVRRELEAVAQLHVDLTATRAVAGDESALTEIFLNLLANAIDACAAVPRARIWVRSYDTPGGASVEIEDSGPGIPEADRERVFEPFFTTKGSAGTGLGLYICRRIAREHGGSIDFRPAREAGTVFVVRLPAQAEEPDVDA
jgi:polar amino acid transport system substrate-binding protein